MSIASTNGHGLTTAVPVASHAKIDTAGLREKVTIKNLEFFYGDSRALKSISLSLYANKATAFIGPSGCGKSTLLRVLNRMYDLYPGQRATGDVMFDGDNLLRADQAIAHARRCTDIFGDDEAGQQRPDLNRVDVGRRRHRPAALL